MGVIGTLASSFSSIWSTFGNLTSSVNNLIASFTNILTMLFTLNFALFLFGIFIMYKLFLKPYLLVRYYGSQGARTFYFPLLGDMGPLSIFKNITLLMKGDIYYRPKQMIKKDPDMKAYCTNVGNSVGISFIDPNLVRDFLNKQEFYIKAKHMIGQLPEIANEYNIIVTILN